MRVIEIVQELRKELERIDKLILALDAFQSGRRRGRPPKLLQQLREAEEREKKTSKASKKKSGKKKSSKSARKKSRKAPEKKPE